MAAFLVQPKGPGLVSRGAALLVAHLGDQTTLLAPCSARNQAPAQLGK